MKLLEVQNLSVRYGSLTIVDDVSFSLEEGQWFMLIGPNGAGKSTLVNAIVQAVPYAGRVLFDGHNIGKMKARELARKIAVLAQSYQVGYSFTVGEVVRLGRYAYAEGLLKQQQDDDEQRVAEALEMTGLSEIANQSILTLSGGELQRTFLAQVFAQNPRLLILDEPTNHLDLLYQKQTFALIKDWLKQKGRAVISVVHDLSLAKAYGSDALLLDKGKSVALGRNEFVFSAEHLNKAYAMDVYAWMHAIHKQWNHETEAKHGL